MLNLSHKQALHNYTGIQYHITQLLIGECYQEMPGFVCLHYIYRGKGRLKPADSSQRFVRTRLLFDVPHTPGLHDPAQLPNKGGFIQQIAYMVTCHHI